MPFPGSEPASDPTRQRVPLTGLPGSARRRAGCPFPGAGRTGSGTWRRPVLTATWPRETGRSRNGGSERRRRATASRLPRLPPYDPLSIRESACSEQRPHRRCRRVPRSTGRSCRRSGRPTFPDRRTAREGGGRRCAGRRGLTGRTLVDLRAVISGAGAAGVATPDAAGRRHRSGHRLRPPGRRQYEPYRPQPRQTRTRPPHRRHHPRNPRSALAGADVFIGVSAGTVTEDTSAPWPLVAIIFALANPHPEIDPAVAWAVARAGPPTRRPPPPADPPPRNASGSGPGPPTRHERGVGRHPAG